MGEGRHQPVRHLAAGQPAGHRRASTSTPNSTPTRSCGSTRAGSITSPPQLYWPIAQEKQSFPKLLDWWAGENTKKRHLWPGLYTEPVMDRQGEGLARRRRSSTRSRSRASSGGATGVIHFSMKAFMRNAGGVADEVKKVYAEPALVPETPWLASGTAPAAPVVTRESLDGRDVLRIKAEEGTRFVVVRGLSTDARSAVVRGVPADGMVTVPLPLADKVVITALDRVSRESEPAEVPR